MLCRGSRHRRGHGTSRKRRGSLQPSRSLCSKSPGPRFEAVRSRSGNAIGWSPTSDVASHSLSLSLLARCFASRVYDWPVTGKGAAPFHRAILFVHTLFFGNRSSFSSFLWGIFILVCLLFLITRFFVKFFFGLRGYLSEVFLVGSGGRSFCTFLLWTLNAANACVSLARPFLLHILDVCVIR